MHCSVYRRGTAWYASYTDRDGKRLRHVLPDARSKAEAKLKVADLLRAERRVAAGETPRLDNRAELGPLLEAFLLHKLACRRAATCNYYRTALADSIGRWTLVGKWEREPARARLWPPQGCADPDAARAMPRRFAPGCLGVSRVEQLTRGAVEQWIEGLSGSTAIRTRNMRVQALKTFLAWAVEGGRILSNPLKGVSWAGRPAKRQRSLCAEECERLLAASPEPYRTLWLAFLSTGLRLGELVQLCWPDVDFRTETIRVRPETSKSKRQRDVPMTPALRARLAEMRNAVGPVFVNAAGTAWRHNLTHRLDRCAELAEVETAGLCVHTLRHTFATLLFGAGTPLKVVSQLLGHATIAITADIYCHVLPRDLGSAVSALPFATSASHKGVTNGHTRTQRLAAQ